MGREMTMCHPRLQILAQKLVEECARQGLAVKIGESFRSVKEQDALYAQGRTKPGAVVTNAKGSSYSSMHQWGVAFDFYRGDQKGAYNEEGNFFEKVGAVGKSLGLEWGGDWKSIIDRPHLQLPDWGSTPSGLKSRYKTYERFRKTWEPLPGAPKTEEQENTAEKSSHIVAYCCGNGVRVRGKAGTDGKILGAINHENLFDVLGYESKWVYAQVGDTRGYIHQDYVAYYVGTCTGNGVRLRKEPSLTGKVLGQLNRGNLVDVLDFGSEWVRVNAGGTRGYLYKTYLD